VRSWWEAAHTFGSLATGIAAVAALLLTYQSLAVTERGQVSDRFGRAVEHLAADTTDVRLGGIYALERLMTDSPDDQPTVIEVLSAFIRTHASTRSGNPEGKSAESPTGMAVDIQAALTVLGRRAPEHDGHARIDLSHTDLRNADLYRANLTNAILNGADLRSASLFDADMVDTHLECARTDDETILPPGVDPETRTYC
jgi:hypothetical protein